MITCGVFRLQRCTVTTLVIFSASTGEYLEHIKEVIRRVAGHGRRVKVSKCVLAEEQMALLVQVDDQYGV